MPEAVIVAAARTPIGRAFKGSLASVRADDLAGGIIDAVMDKVPQLDRGEVADVMMGAASHAGEQGMNLGRNAAALGGLPESVPGTTINRGCGSSLQTIRMAHQAIVTGEGHAFVAAGVESVSRAPSFYDENAMNPRFLDRSRPDYINDMYLAMGQTAENVAQQWGLTRQSLDEFALLSQQRAAAAIEAGFFAREITPVTLPDGTVVDRDDWAERRLEPVQEVVVEEVVEASGLRDVHLTCHVVDRVEQLDLGLGRDQGERHPVLLRGEAQAHAVRNDGVHPVAHALELFEEVATFGERAELLDRLDRLRDWFHASPSRLCRRQRVPGGTGGPLVAQRPPVGLRKPRARDPPALLPCPISPKPNSEAGTRVDACAPPGSCLGS
jgi:hypothetical protein